MGSEYYNDNRKLEPAMPPTTHSAAVSDLENLAALARAGGGDSLSVSLRVQTDLIINAGEPSHDMIGSYESFVSAALPLVDDHTAQIVASKLALWMHATLKLRQLVKATSPQASTLMAALDLATAETELIQIAETGAAALPPALLAMLARRAQTDDWLAQTLLRRDDLPALALLPLFAKLERHQQTFYCYAVSRHLALAPIRAVRPATPETVTTFTALAANLNTDTCHALAQLAGGGGILGEAIKADTQRMLTAFSLLSAGFDADEATRVLLVIGDDVSQSISAIFALNDLVRGIKPETARFIVSAMSGDPMIRVMEHRVTTHVPVADPSATPARAGHIVTTPQRRSTDWGTLLPIAKPEAKKA
jgi:hypothetical protein